MKLDEKNLKILDILKRNSKLTTQQIAKKLGMPTSTVHNRIKNLEKEGVIHGYTVVLDYKKLGKPLLAHILVKSAYKSQNGEKVSQEALAASIKKLGADEVATVLVDEADILVSVRVKDLYEVKEFTKKLQETEGVQKTHTLIVLNKI